MKNRVLVIAHAHPDFSLGGGEIAAYNLYKAYQEQPEIEKTWFLARADKQRGNTGAITLRRTNEYLWEQGISDWFLMKAANQESLHSNFTALIRAIKPTLIHAHHYAHLGLEYLRVIKQIDPAIKIIMTLHEYMAICNNQGQMIKTGNFKLCNRESFDDCRNCFPDKSVEDFWLRKHYFMRHFDLVDQFIAPSEFLRQRYIDWGIKAERIVVIENGQIDGSPLPPRPLAEGETRNRFGFFGQINPYKGLHVVLQALHEIPKSERKKIFLEVHGANLENQSTEFQQKIDALRKPLMEQGIVKWMGSYQPHELRQRMAGIDWVVVPSIWWENSPMVIQEAFVCGRPLLVSDIGGMKEKVNCGLVGRHIATGSTFQWAAAIQNAARLNEIEAFNHFIINLVAPKNCSEVANLHLRQFDRLPL